MPSISDKKLWADVANQIKASRERCQVAYKNGLYSVKVIAQSHDAIARSHLQIADVDYRRDCCLAGLAVLSKKN